MLRLAAVMSLCLLGGCGGQSITFPTPESELGDAPGLLSGAQGALVLYPLREEPSQRR
jgi:hypothetical protein